MRHARRLREGFTLLEMIVAVLIFAAISVAVAATLSAGLKVWQRATTQDHALPDALIGCEILERDIGNALRFYAIPLDGGPDFMTFPILLNTDLDGGSWRPAIGTVAYRFDASAGSIKRKVWRFPLAEPGDEAAEAVVSGLDRAVFSYLMPKPGKPAYFVWRSETGSDPARPQAVRLAAQTRRVEDHDGTAFTRTMRLRL